MARRLRERNPSHAPSDNLDRWMISYADFITLLFAFFVVMYAISAVNVDKYKVFSMSVVSAFGGHEDVNIVAGTNQDEALLKALVNRRNAKLMERLHRQQEYMQAVAQNLNQVMAPLVAGGQVSVNQTERGVVLEIKASALFDEGDATLHHSSVAVLSEVAKILSQGEQAIEIGGYSDNVPIKNARYPSNWELSSARASSVARLFIEQGVPPARLTVVGSAFNHPVASNDTAEGRARNRRIAVTLLAPPQELSPPPAQQPEAP
jgi:chemotaxis protein MotB